MDRVVSRDLLIKARSESQDRKQFGLQGHWASCMSIGFVHWCRRGLNFKKTNPLDLSGNFKLSAHKMMCLILR